MPINSSDQNTMELESYNYLFPAIRGIQAEREYYIAMCPIKLIPRMFLFDEEELPPELRAQRTLNRSRIPEIARYVINHPKDYVFSAITASIDSKVQFKSLGDNGKENKMGTLIVPMTANFLINDGQHRRAAIEEALKVRPEVGLETIPVVFFIDAGLKRSQQMFADLNKHAVRPTKSLGILYDNRDPFARLALFLVDSVPLFKGFTELEKTTISNRSIKMFTLSSIYQATIDLLGKKQKDKSISEIDRKRAIEYWTEVSKIIPEWELLIKNEVSSHELRRDYIHAHGVALHALGIVGNALIAQYPENWKKQLLKLKNIDWSRSNTKLWEGRAMIGGRINKSQMNLLLTSNVLKNVLGLELNPDEEKAELSFKTRAN
ncbi:MAG: DNA sulfur modification protein DndB [Methanosarcinaceae archaeon]|nr:DNA sulfur modification protein DndB [Methanosarcinaceae archaeon]